MFWAFLGVLTCAWICLCLDTPSVLCFLSSLLTAQFQENLLNQPLWPVSVKLQPRAGQTLSPPDPPWQRCEGGCSRWLWQHQDGPCVVAVAAQSLFFPDGMQCGGGSDPPGRTITLIKMVATVSQKVTNYRREKCALVHK